ncbi:MAG: CDP-2,3-bis-(O-geranylgeranyl)-sn-glycerol synthase [Sulfolobales archaeon]|nr:CDP-2,3-bis-(O-geranylgeranyl)-sn-glycerol synthase [Sulfolobales archaeon]MCX8198626.1 CDP-2,3-bis-(O-geranylgeranyl)-sn-glycerol synthase [Sulfolobales archaeon]MDW8169700.1 CDP-2,3-bis-(O-geranylgeranyl)-sn-glycerol synthase [Desulfurococcaceae archaeon]
MSLVELSAFLENFIKFYGAPMIANAMPVLINGSKPIDGGRLWIDGKRVFGDGKTWEGLTTGLLGGYMASLALSTYFNSTSLIPVLLTASAAALLGDLTGSFIKRRLGLRRGDPAPLLDQLDFALFATLTHLALGNLSIFNDLSFIALSLAAIALLHIATNYIAYTLKLKNRPW